MPNKTSTWLHTITNVGQHHHWPLWRPSLIQIRQAIHTRVGIRVKVSIKVSGVKIRVWIRVKIKVGSVKIRVGIRVKIRVMVLILGALFSLVYGYVIWD